jgi:hypothetical protein
MASAMGSGRPAASIPFLLSSKPISRYVMVLPSTFDSTAATSAYERSSGPVTV